MTDAEKVRSSLKYDANTGEFVWLTGNFSGRKAGCRTKDGYLYIGFRGRSQYAHRLAWLYVHGVWPAAHIDHINGNRSDNRIENLRPATVAENAQNRIVYRNNKSGLMGVTKRGDTFIAQIQVDGKHLNLGQFSSADDAHQSYLAAKEKFHSFQPVVRHSSHV